MDVDTAVTMQSVTDDRGLVAIAAGALAGGDSPHALCTRAAIEGPGPGDDDDDDDDDDDRSNGDVGNIDPDDDEGYDDEDDDDDEEPLQVRSRVIAHVGQLVFCEVAVQRLGVAVSS